MTDAFTQPSTLTTIIFLILVAALIAAVFALYTRHPGGHRVRWGLLLGAWLGVGAALPASGLLERTLPIGLPAFMPFMALSLLAVAVLACSRASTRLIEGDAAPITALIALQGFRLPLELVLHAWYEGGTLPIQMTFEGYNFDILTGVLALLVGAVLWRVRLCPRARWWLVLVFNVIGTALLAAVGTLAVLSAPGPLRAFHEGPPVLLVLVAPYAWIVTVCVGGALWAHLLVWRWLARQRGRAAQGRLRSASPR